LTEYPLDISSLEKMIDSGRDSAMLRLSLARLLAQHGRPDDAVMHLEAALDMKPEYTAAWKELGRQHMAAGRIEDARQAWERGIVIANQNGDKQAGKEMTVFLRRLDKPSA